MVIGKHLRRRRDYVRRSGKLAVAAHVERIEQSAAAAPPAKSATRRIQMSGIGDEAHHRHADRDRRVERTAGDRPDGKGPDHDREADRQPVERVVRRPLRRRRVQDDVDQCEGEQELDKELRARYSRPTAGGFA